MMSLKILTTAVLLVVFQVLSFAQTRDTTFLLREGQNKTYHAIYIDPNPASGWYDSLLVFDFDEYRKSSYTNAIAYLKQQRPGPFARHPLGDLPLQWLPVYPYKKQYYLYWPCDYTSNYKLALSDTTAIEYFGTSYMGYYGDALSINRLQSFAKTDDHTYQLVLTDDDQPERMLLIHLMDRERGIAIFEDPSSEPAYRYYWMVDAKKARNFPVIVNQCNTSSQGEHTFDTTDFKQLLKIK